MFHLNFYAVKRKFYNDPKNQRSEIPENFRRLHISKNVMLFQRVALLKDGELLWDLLFNHINNYPNLVYKHVYDYRSFPRYRIRLDTVGEKHLFEQLDKQFPKISSDHRFFKRKQIARMNLMKEIYPIHKGRKK